MVGHPVSIVPEGKEVPMPNGRLTDTDPAPDPSLKILCLFLIEDIIHDPDPENCW